MPIAMTDKDNNRYYLHYDQVGSLRAISDKDHNIIKEITYDTYGNIIKDTNPDFKVPFGFAGGLYDSDTGLTHFGYREYDSFTGKWTAKDPIGFDGGDSNLYGYVLQDPVSGVDPFGLWIIDLLFPEPLGEGSDQFSKFNNIRIDSKTGKVIKLDPQTGKPLSETDIKCETRKPPLSEQPWIDDLLEQKRAGKVPAKRPPGKLGLLLELLCKLVGGC